MLDRVMQGLRRRFGGLAQALVRAAAAAYRGERGATTAEYALILALIAIVLIAALTELGATLRDKLEQIIAAINGVEVELD